MTLRSLLGPALLSALASCAQLDAPSQNEPGAPVDPGAAPRVEAAAQPLEPGFCTGADAPDPCNRTCADDPGRSLEVVCGGGQQLCEPAFKASCVALERKSWKLELTAGAGHCANVRYTLKVDGELRYTTDFLSAGTSSGWLDAGVLEAGPHTFAVQGEGRNGGCNEGQLFSWNGTLRTQLETPTALNAPSGQPPVQLAPR